MNPGLPRQRLLIVSGKGGVGKSTVAVALALCEASAGHRTLLVTADSRDSHHAVFDRPVTYVPQQVAPNLALARLDAIDALVDYVKARVPLGFMYEPLLRGGALRDFVGAVPGFDELMCLGRVYNLIEESGYDRIVFDAPATGHIRQWLEVPEAVRRAVGAGPLHHVATRIKALLFDSARTRLVPVTLPEELPVTEATELCAFARANGMAAGPLVVNQCSVPEFSDREVAILSRLADAGPVSVELSLTIQQVKQMAARHAAEVAALAPLLASVNIIGQPVHLPRIDGGAARDRVAALAERFMQTDSERSR